MKDPGSGLQDIALLDVSTLIHHHRFSFAMSATSFLHRQIFAQYTSLPRSLISMWQGHPAVIWLWVTSEGVSCMLHRNAMGTDTCVRAAHSLMFERV